MIDVLPPTIAAWCGDGEKPQQHPSAASPDFMQWIGMVPAPRNTGDAMNALGPELGGGACPLGVSMHESGVPIGIAPLPLPGRIAHAPQFRLADAGEGLIAQWSSDDVVVAHGRHEGISVLVAWQLRASGRLSHAGRVDGEPSAHPQLDWVATQPMPVHAGIHERSALAAPQRVAEVLGAVDSMQAGAVLDVELRVSAPDPRVEAEAPRDRRMASTESWPAQLVRLIERELWGTELRVRDYRLGDAEIAQIVTVLHRFADRYGIRLGRAIINGHEVWSARALRAEESRDAC